MAGHGKEARHMERKGTIKNSEELEFAAFCIENIALSLNADVEQVYKALTEKDCVLC